MTDPLWVAEYTLYLEENFCPTQVEAERLIDNDKFFCDNLTFKLC